uniref:Proteasome subunit beta n=1 Tax=Ditylenchus dipsaci TaxID=166011 RepID=A0A915EM25_9BILA
MTGLGSYTALPLANPVMFRQPFSCCHLNKSAFYRNMEEDYGMEKAIAIPALGHYPREPISTGTTLIALQYDEGVVVGTDSRTSAGSFIASRATNKITPITKSIVVCRSGSAADTQAIADIVSYYVETYEMMEGEKVSVERTTQIFRSFLYNYRDQMSASVLVAGFDKKLGGQIYAIPLGGFVTRQHFTASGSGSTFVTGGQTVSQNVGGLATMRDGSSGGVIRLAVINKAGTERSVIRPDTKLFPTITEPPAFPSLPQHIHQKQEESVPKA